MRFCNIFVFFLIFSKYFLWNISAFAVDRQILLPTEFVENATEDQVSPLIVNDQDGKPAALTINPQMQNYLTKFIRDRGNPISAVVVAEVATGKILALAQGRSPQQWGQNHNSVAHAQFPAASLFKTVSAGAAFDLTDIEPGFTFGLEGGCSDVRPTGVWLNDQVQNSRNQMSIFKAYGQSCNGFFAKVGVNTIGLKTLVDYAMRFGWDGKIDTDVVLEKSPLNAPNLRNSSVHAVGRFAAGFGEVGISPIHAAWIMLALANNGMKKPILLRQDSIGQASNPSINEGFRLSAINPDYVMISARASAKLRTIMSASVQKGTASFAFRRGKHRIYRELVGGKTGTLNGHNPAGVTTWFAGMMPLENPKIVVAAVVVLEDLWHIKGPNLAAEAFWAYDEFTNSPRGPISNQALIH